MRPATSTHDFYVFFFLQTVAQMALNFEVTTACFCRGTPNSNSWMCLALNVPELSLQVRTSALTIHSKCPGCYFSQTLLTIRLSSFSRYLDETGWRTTAGDLTEWRHFLPTTNRVHHFSPTFKELSYICSLGIMKRFIEISWSLLFVTLQRQTSGCSSRIRVKCLHVRLASKRHL